MTLHPARTVGGKEKKKMKTRRSAAANRSRVSIRVIKILAGALWTLSNFPHTDVWSPCKIWLLFLVLCARM